MTLFLQGDRGIGKSTLLREALLPHQGEVAGFAVQRLREEGRVAGFRAVSIEGELPPLEAAYSPGQSGVFLLGSTRDPAGLEAVMARAEAHSCIPGCKLILLDEIGGIELTAAPFMAALDRLLAGPVPCVGVLKSRANLAHTLSRLGLGEGYLALHAALEERIRAGGSLLTLEPGNREGVRRQVLGLVEAVWPHSK